MVGRLTKTEKKRLIKAIYNKTQKLFTMQGISDGVVTPKDMDTIYNMCKRWDRKVG